MAVRRPIQTLNLALGGEQSIEAGKINIPQGKCMPELPHRLTFSLNNTSGGAIVLTEAQRIAVLDHLKLTMRGAVENGPSHEPHTDVKFSRIRDIEREVLREECVGFEDTVTGLKRSLPNAAITTAEVTVSVPTGRNNRIKELAQGIGVGPSQAKVYELGYKVPGAVAGLPAGVTITNIKIEPFPDLDPCVGDPLVLFTAIKESSFSGTLLALPDGLAECAYLKDHDHVNTTLTQLKTGFDDEVIMDRSEPQQYLAQIQKAPDAFAAADISDRVTYLNTLPQQVSLVAEPERVHTGRFFFEDSLETLGNISYGYFHRPIMAPGDYAAWHAFVSAQRQGKTVRGVSTFAVRGLAGKVHDRFAPYFGVTFFVESDSQYQQFPAWWGAAGEKLAMYIPETGRVQLREAVKRHRAAGNGQVASKALDAAAVALPTAVQSGRGLKRGSPARTAFEAKVMG
jgi:hypothetical protein